MEAQTSNHQPEHMFPAFVTTKDSVEEFAPISSVPCGSASPKASVEGHRLGGDAGAIPYDLNTASSTNN